MSTPAGLVGLPVATLFGTDIHAVTMGQALDLVHETIVNRNSLHIGVVNAAKMVNMQSDPVLKQSVESSDLILADGNAVVKATKLLGCPSPLPERVTGIDLMFGMFERGKSHGYRVYCLGATEEISAKVAQKLEENYPGVVLAGRRNGYFDESEEEGLAKLL